MSKPAFLFGKKTAKKSSAKLFINILYPQGSKDKLPVRFLKWLISYGRFIVIIVEVVVLTTFAYRFKLDAELSTLGDKIKNQIPIIESLSGDEALITQTQLKLSTIKKVYTLTPNWQKTLDKISAQLPSGVKINTLSLEPIKNTSSTNFRLTAQGSSNNDVAVFLNGLKNDKSVRNISLNNINFDQGSIVFTVTGVID